ncbi:TPA: DNA primase [Candidatus Micrarchaeota archaeon]|nr:DNA primase [Candidatus Micrarchaeota archaeon]
MGKTYIDTVKYVVTAKIEVDGLVDKSDVVGAVFGQTEGLLGDELDLRELQKNGRIGRIEVDLKPLGGKSIGMITLPSSLDIVETSILAAALETVDRVGPCEAKLTIERIEDTRNQKRKTLVDRAKGLVKQVMTTEIPESRELADQVREEVRTAELCEFGPEKLPCGPNITKYDSIIICEGRADVLNLLKNDLTNVVGIGGAKIPPSIAKLCLEKEVTVFLDGDRGGDIILRELAEVADIDFVARAPWGKEVEELTRKEIIKALRAKVPFEQFMENLMNSSRGGPRRLRYGEKGGPGTERPDRSPERSDRGGERDRRPSYPEPERTAARVFSIERPRPVPATAPTAQQPERVPAPTASQPSEPLGYVSGEAAAPKAEEGTVAREIPAQFISSLGELENTLRARFYDKAMAMFKEVPVREIIKVLEEESSIGAIVFDGIITQRLVDLSESKGVKYLVGIKTGNVFRRPANIITYNKS